MGDRSDHIQAALNSERPSERRRAVLALALGKGREDEIVDAVVCDDVECYLAIRMTGRAAAKRLCLRLLEPKTRARALAAIALLRPATLSEGNLVQPLREHAARDENLHVIVSLLDSITSRADPEIGQRRLVQKLAGAKWDGSVPAMYATGVIFKETRPWALPMVRSRLERALVHLDEEGVENEVGGLIHCLLLAASSGSVDDTDIVLMEKAWHEVETQLGPPDEAVPFEPPVRWAVWLGRGRHFTDLRKALRCSGDEDPPYEMRFLYSFNEFLGDRLLEPAEIPLLWRQAADEDLDDRVRVGAIRILRYLGSVDDRVHGLFLKLLGAEKETIRLAAAEAIGACVENETQPGRLLAAVKDRLRDEASPRVVSALRDAEGQLTSF